VKSGYRDECACMKTRGNTRVCAYKMFYLGYNLTTPEETCCSDVFLPYLSFLTPVLDVFDAL